MDRPQVVMVNGKPFFEEDPQLSIGCLLLLMQFGFLCWWVLFKVGRIFLGWLGVL